MSLVGNTELLSTKCRGIGPHLAVSGSLMSFIELRQAPGVYSRVRVGMGFETRVFSAKSGLLSSYDGHLGKLNYAWQENTDAYGGEPGGQASLISWHSYIGIPINFHEESGIVTF